MFFKQTCHVLCGSLFICRLLVLNLGMVLLKNIYYMLLQRILITYLIVFFLVNRTEILVTRCELFEV